MAYANAEMQRNIIIITAMADGASNTLDAAAGYAGGQAGL